MKVFRAHGEASGYGPRIFIARDQEPSNEIRSLLDALSIFKGNTSSSPEYYMWEFSFNGVDYAKAYLILRTNGFMTARP